MIGRNAQPQIKPPVHHRYRPALAGREADKPNEALVAGVRRCCVVDSFGGDGEPVPGLAEGPRDLHSLTAWTGAFQILFSGVP